MSDNKKAYYIHQSMGKHPHKIKPIVKIYAAPAKVLKNYKLVYEYVFVKVFRICRRIANKYVSFLYSPWSAMEDSTFLHLMEFNTTYSILYDHPPDSNLWTSLLSGCPK